MVRRGLAVPAVSVGTYTEGDELSGVFELSNCLRRSEDYSGELSAVQIYDKEGAGPILQLWVFDRTFTPAGSNAPFDPSDETVSHVLGVVDITAANWLFGLSTGIVCKNALSIPVLSQNQHLYGILVVGTGGVVVAAANPYRLSFSVKSD